MATDPGASPSTSLIDRVKNLLLQPKLEWAKIDAEPSTIARIYRNYVVILAGIPPLCLMVGLLLLMGAWISPGYLIGQAILTYILYLLCVYLVALAIDALAPTFSGTKNQVSAFKVAAYSMTAAWVCGLVLLLPFLFPLMIVGAAYSVYLLYLGLPLLMKVPADKAIAYVAAVAVAAILIGYICQLIVQRAMYTMIAPPSTITLTVPRS